MTNSASAAASPAAPVPSLFSDSGSLAQKLGDAFLAVRNETERRAAPLSAEDQLVQSMPDASPAKWHRAHTTWFFEQFLLGEHCPGYQPYHPDYAFLFNSYYVSAGPRHARAQRGHLTRPSADEVTAYRRHVDAAVIKFFNTTDAATLAALVPLLEVGFNHEQQHQELMLTDILHAFAQNPIPPAYDPGGVSRPPAAMVTDGLFSPRAFTPSGMRAIRSTSTTRSRRIARWSGPVRLKRNLVTNGEWLAFMKDGGYRTATLWLMDGFAAVGQRGMAGARSLAQGRWRMAGDDAGWLAADRSRKPGLSRQLLRSRCVRALERQAPADRDGMGSRRAAPDN